MEEAIEKLTKFLTKPDAENGKTQTQSMQKVGRFQWLCDTLTHMGGSKSFFLSQ